MATKRLLIEYSKIQKELEVNDEMREIIELKPTDNIFNWICKIKGPQDSPFKNGIWKLNIEVSNSYPLQPPKIKFENKICHPNVDFRTGEICLDILQSQWSPAWSLISTIQAILLLISSPEPNSPLNIDASNLLKHDLKAYNNLVNYYAIKHSI